MGAVGGSLHHEDAQHGKPEVWPELRPLLGWSREDVVDTFETFRASVAAPSPSVSLETFNRLLSFEGQSTAEAAFARLQPKRSRIDFLQVIGPMILFSDQHFASKASLLFSVHDLGGAGSLDRSELGIAVFTVMRGLSCFVSGQLPPGAGEIERLTNSIFDHIDEHGDGFVTLGDWLSFAYRSPLWRYWTSIVPTYDIDVFEEQVPFASPLSPMGNRSSARTRASSVRSEASVAASVASSHWTVAGEGRGAGVVHQANPQVERRLRNRLRLTPDPSEDPSLASVYRFGRPIDQKFRRYRRRPWRKPTAFMRGTAWSVWCFFRRMAHGGRTIPLKELLAVVVDDLRTAIVLEEATSGQDVVANRPPDVHRVLQHFCLQLSGGHVPARLEALAGADHNVQHISLRGLICAVWHLVGETEVEILIGWCRAYHAQHALSQVLRELKDDELALDAGDIEAAFEAVEGNSDGHMSLDGFRMKGRVNLYNASQYMRKCSTAESDIGQQQSPSRRASGGSGAKSAQASATLSKAQMKAIIFHLDLALREQFRIFHGDQDSSPGGSRAVSKLTAWSGDEVGEEAAALNNFGLEEVGEEEGEAGGLGGGSVEERGDMGLVDPAAPPPPPPPPAVVAAGGAN